MPEPGCAHAETSNSNATIENTAAAFTGRFRSRRTSMVHTPRAGCKSDLNSSTQQWRRTSMILLRIARRLNTFRVAEGLSNAQNGRECKNKPLHEEKRFWDVLAEQHAAMEDNFLDLASLRRIIG